MSSRDRYLRETIQHAERVLQSLPEGKVNHQKGNIWRYSGPEDFCSLHGPDNQLLEELILRSYLEKLLRAAEQELKARGRFFKNQPAIKMEEVYDGLSEYRKQIIEPFIPTPQQKIDEWLNQTYPSHNPIPLTDKFPTGVAACPYVRSKSEIVEVQRMTEEGMAFLYEFPLDLVDMQGRVKTIYPDFTILNRKTWKVVYWEHWGRMSNTNYLETFKDKQELYAKNGIFGSKLYQTFEFSGRPLTLLEVDAAIADLKKICGW